MSPGDEIFDVLLDINIDNVVIIPFNFKQRKEKFPRAFKELQRNMEKDVWFLFLSGSFCLAVRLKHAAQETHQENKPSLQS